jgi:gliding motility-associated-like protein
MSSGRLYTFWLLALAAFTVRLSAQCTGSFALPADTTLCAGQPLTILAPTGYLNYLWSTGATTPSITVSAAGTYSCTVTDFGAGGNLVLNSDFNAGATGFVSDYVPGTGGPWGPVSLPGTYATATSPVLVHTNFASFGDHTTGTGNMLVVNGAQVAGQNVWCQTVNVLPNTTYAFSAWLASAVNASPAQLQYTVNGVPIGNLNASAFVGQWNNFYSLWSSGTATTAVLCITNLNTQQSGNDFAIDDITFSPLCTYSDAITLTYNPYPAPDLGPDVVHCADTSVVLDPQWPGADAYAWQDGSSGPTFVPQATGVVWVDVTEDGCTTRDSVNVSVLPLPLADLGPDQQRCDGQVTVLDATWPAATYLWNDGSTAPTRTLTTSATCWVTLDLAGCTDADTATVTYFPLPIVDLGADTTICPSDVLALDVFRAGGSYLWHDGSTGPQFNATTADVLWVVVTENGCSTTDSLVLREHQLPAVDLGPDRLLCAGNTEELDASGPGYSHLWSDGSTEPTLVVDGPGLYWVIATNLCASDADSVRIDWDYCDCPVYAPNAFTPDADGNNEGFLPRFACPNRSYTLRIYDRWGAVQWESTDDELIWDGQGLPTGVYPWTIEYEPESKVVRGKRLVRGHVVLLR